MIRDLEFIGFGNRDVVLAGLQGLNVGALIIRIGFWGIV